MHVVPLEPCLDNLFIFIWRLFLNRLKGEELLMLFSFLVWPCVGIWRP